MNRKGYAVVDECGFCHGIFELKKQAEHQKDFMISASLSENPQIIEGEEAIEELVFATDGNSEYMENFYEVFPVDAGFKIKIPTERIEYYLLNAIDNLASAIEESVYKECPELSDERVWEIVDQRLESYLDCNPHTLDKILHGEYWIV